MGRMGEMGRMREMGKKKFVPSLPSATPHTLSPYTPTPKPSLRFNQKIRPRQVRDSLKDGKAAAGGR
jgi:hypothetical protein